MVTPIAAPAPRKKQPLFSGRMAVDGLVTALMLAAGLAGFWPVFDGSSFIRPAAVGLVAGALVALFGRWWRWPAPIVALATIAFYMLLGTAAAVPQEGTSQVLPTGVSLRTVIFGSVEVWRQFVTAMTPVAGLTGLTLVPFAVALVGAVVAFSVVWRARRVSLTLIPVVVVFVAVIALGVVTPFFPTVQGLVLAGLAIGWLAWRRSDGASESSAVRRSRFLNSVILIAVAAVAASFAAPAMASAVSRDVVRLHVVPPLDVQAYPSPLSSFRDLITTRKDDDLFTVANWNPDYRLRLAVMDFFDGTVYNASDASGASRYDRVGPNLGQTGRSSTDQTITVTVDGYTGVWVPGVATFRSLSFGGPAGQAANLTDGLYYNPAADAAIDPVGLAQGDTYTLTADVTAPVANSTSQLESVALPAPENVPPAVATLASTWAADAKTPYDTVAAIVNTFHDTGYYSDGLSTQQSSLPGHSTARIAALLKDPQAMVGDDEQYAVAAALMLQSLGIPARVVMGFQADSSSHIDGTTWTVIGADVHAWIEVPFQGAGWVAFDPSPDRNKIPEQQSQQAKTKPRPQVLTPPVAANDNSQPDSQNPGNNQPKENKPHTTSIWPTVRLVGGSVGGLALLVFGPLIVIGIIKGRRRRAREQVADPAAKVVGGWQELMDRAADMGAVVPPAATRRQASRLLATRFDTANLPGLAAAADSAAFAPQPPVPQAADIYWAGVRGVIGQFRHKLSPFGRYKAGLSLASLRRNPRSTFDLEETS